MHKIEKRPFGFQLTFGGDIDVAEIQQWREEARTAVSGAPKLFGVLIDMRTLRPGGLHADAQPIMTDGQSLFKKAGMQRSAVILQSATVTMQFERIAKQSGIDAFERYINAAATPDWEARAVRWIEQKVEPSH